MAIAYIVKEELFIYAMRGELAPKKRSGFGSGSYWAITAMMSLSEEETDQYPVTLWRMKLNLKPAVEKIVLAKKAVLEYLDKDTCESRVLAILSETASTLNPEIDEQYLVDKDAALM